MAARSTALIAAATLVAGLLVSGTPAAAQQLPEEHTVTLLTGDRVALTKAPGGRQIVRIQPGPGRADQIFFKQAKGDQLTVMPGDVAGQVRSGRLDRALFDVTGLIEQGYDDTSRKDLPVIISGALHGTSVHRDLPSIGAYATTLEKGRFWASGDARIRLDRRVKASLDQSVPQIGAPAAWQAGYTGKGVKVAVVDTGYDHAHPDLKNVVAEKDFSGDGVQDGNGHGTHVASTVAGSGAASNGKYRGVAPDASLVIAKALDNDGGGSLSDVIDAVEWAADEGAKVISMSLGTSEPSDGTDDLALAVNRISREKGVLFVVAAGNEGADMSIGTPGAADAALTVGSVSKQDVLSKFSSRGPRFGDFAVKPDVTAPGEEIVAARAGHGDYVAGTGTSMATPHVSGAAALLAQQHPQWTGEQIKTALTSSAKPGSYPVYAQGTGRVDVARAVTQAVTATTNLSFSLVRWPHSTGRPETKDVTYTNQGTAPVELALSFTSDAPAGLFTVSADKVVVPAGGTAAVSVRSNPSVLKPGQFSGRLTATGGGAVVQTVVGLSGERESYDVTVELIDRTGAPASDDLEHAVGFFGAEYAPIYVQQGQGKVRLPKGVYRLASLISTKGSATLAGDPNLSVTKDVTITLDARKGRKVSVRPERKAATDLYRSFGAIVGDGKGSTAAITAYAEDRAVEFYAVPAPSGGVPYSFSTVYDAQATDSLDADLVARGPFYSLVHHWPGRIPNGVNLTVRDRDLAKVKATFGSKNGKSGLVARVINGFSPMQVFGNAAFARVHQPGERTEYYTAGKDVFWINALYRVPGDGTNAPSPLGIVWATVYGFHAGAQTEPWNHAVEGPGLPGPAQGLSGSEDILWVGHWGDTIDGRLPLFADVGQYQHTRFDPAVTGGWTVYRDGVKVEESKDYSGFSGPAVTGPAEYRVDGFADRTVPWSELSTHVEGSWTFRASNTTGARFTPAPVIAIKFAPALDAYNRAPATARTLVPLRLERQGGTPDLPLTELAVQASFDDGKTWAPAPVVRTGRAGYAVVANPKVTGKTFVSLQVKAKDSGGSSVTTKVIRAYQLGTSG
ncbi:S8 family peptidase [Lentzea tibetensis]|nr:S8 family peptidase [Lentzea tibetensis]